MDAETGKVLSRSLKSIAKSKVNAENKYANKKQQAGFAAEIADVAAENAENIIEGKRERKIRTDDLGMANDPLYDHFIVDASGTIIAGTGSQMKFVGKDATECLRNLSSKAYDKYHEADALLEIPSDYCDAIKAENAIKIAKIEAQLEKAKASGDTALIEKRQRELDKHKTIDKNLRKSKISNKEAMHARNSPRLYAASQMAKLAHRAGIEGAKSAIHVGGSMAVIFNAVAVIRGEKGIEEAMADAAKDTGKSVAMGYGTTATSTIIKAEMQNAGASVAKKSYEKAYNDAIASGAKMKAAKEAAELAMKEASNAPLAKSLRALSKSDFPSMIVTATIETAKVMKRYLSGEISGEECLIQMGEAGTGMAASSMGAAGYGMVFGTALGPIGAVSGAITGAVIGQMMTSLFYKQLVSSLQEATLAREERIRVEAECKIAIAAIRQYREELEYMMHEFFVDISHSFEASLSEISTALELGDVDMFIFGTNAMTEKLGGKAQFRNLEEFDVFMQSSEALAL